MKVYAVTLLVVDHDDIGPQKLQTVLENQSYANDCIRPCVMRVDTQTVEWTDDHPLNSTRTMRAAFEELFPR